MSREAVIKRHAAPPWALILGGALGLVAAGALAVGIFAALAGGWSALSGRPVEPPRIAFMSSYGAAAQSGYWLFVIATAIAIFTLQAVAVRRRGAGIGHALVGVRMLDEAGEPVGIGALAKKAVANVAFFLMIALPGPVVGFLFGPGSEIWSLILLGSGLLAVAIVSVRTDASGRLMGYAESGIVPVWAAQAEAFRREIKALG